MAPSRRVATGGPSDGSDTTRQQPRDEDSQGTMNHEPPNERGDRYAHLIPSEITTRLDADFLQRYYDQCTRVYRKRMEKEIEQMEREEADDSGQFHASIGGVQYSRPKEQSDIPATSFRSGKPLNYTAKDEKEWRSFINWWKVVFMKESEAWPEEKRIAMAAVEFRGKPLDEWAGLEEDKRPTTWTQFEQWTRNLLSDPENRLQTAYLKIRDLRQKKGQTVRDINNMLELWERDLRNPPNDETKAYNTFMALHPDLRKAVNIETHGKITTREQVTTVAQRNAEQMTLIWDESPAGPSSKKRKRNDGETPEKDKDDSSGPKKKKPFKPDDKDLKDIKCFKCGELGHKSPNCPTKTSPSDKQPSKNSNAQPS
jgi:hypothetical protein